MLQTMKLCSLITHTHTHTETRGLADDKRRVHNSGGCSTSSRSPLHNVTCVRQSSWVNCYHIWTASDWQSVKLEKKIWPEFRSGKNPSCDEGAIIVLCEKRVFLCWSAVACVRLTTRAKYGTAGFHRKASWEVEWDIATHPRPWDMFSFQYLLSRTVYSELQVSTNFNLIGLEWDFNLCTHWRSFNKTAPTWQSFLRSCLFI